MERPGSPDRHRDVATLDALDAVLHHSVNLCVWRRALVDPWPARLDAFTRAHHLDASAELRAGDAALALVAPVDDPHLRAWLADDIARIAARFAALLGVDAVEAHLQTVRTDKCRRLHADHVGLRLLCTYSGPGTEWIPESRIDRDALRTRSGDARRDNDRIAGAHPPLQLGRGDVGVLKGDAWPGNHGFGAVHRSAPVEATGDARLVLKLDRVGATQG